MSLGDFVRVTRTFVEAFKLPETEGKEPVRREKEVDDINRLREDLKVTRVSSKKRHPLFTRFHSGIKTNLYTGASRTTASDDRYAGAR